MTERTLPLLLGVAPPSDQAPGANGGPAFVGTDSGERLAKMCGLIGARILPNHFDLRNVFDHPINQGFDETWAEINALATIRVLERRPWPQRIVACGRFPARALRIGGAPCTWSTIKVGRHTVRAAWIYHPSGRTRQYNDPAVLERTTRFLTTLAGSGVITE